MPLLISVTNYLKLTNHEKEKRRRIYVQQQERLHRLCQDYVNQARDLGEFLRAVGSDLMTEFKPE